MTTNTFPDVARIDAHDKVRGATRYASDDSRPGMLHATLACATIGRGSIQSIDTSAARALRGVRLVLTHAELSRLQPAGFLLAGGYGVQSLQPLTSPNIAYFGQPIALVVAETLEVALQAAALIRTAYAVEPHQMGLDAPEADIVAQQESPLPKPMFEDVHVGDADAVFAQAAVQIDATYASAVQHHNPMELLATVAEWSEGRLTIHEGTQNAEGVRHGVARQLGIPAEQVRVISPQVGGGFGQKNSLQGQTVLAAFAARALGHSVKLVVRRSQLFHASSFRAATRHRIRLGADHGGTMLAAIHETDAQTSRHDLFPSVNAEVSARLHGIANFRARERLVRTDTQTPGYMRAPFEHMACFAFESAVDELAQALGQDPVALRLANDTQRDPVTGKPLSSRHLAECLRRGAARFGWARRSMAPGSMQDAEGQLIGWGVAAGAYKAATAPAVARLRVYDDGTALASVGVHEMGQGIRTALAAALSRKLGIEPDQITLDIGDTNSTPQHITVGSWGTATAVPAAVEAADAMLSALAELLPGDAAGRSPAEILRAAGRRSLDVAIRRKAPGQPDAVFTRLATGLPAPLGPNYPDFVSFSYIAHFVEVRVEPTTRRIRVPRVVSVADCGRVISPRTAASQVRGGVVWGIGAALREASEVDPRYGGFLNADLADYVLPVNADIGDIEVEFIDRADPLVNAMGIKGLGEVAMVGVAAAIANAVHHATGIRLRDLPIRIEHLM
ncbi:xanthine dehydrogenase family protein molybdopterin-binding subunit [Teichococcus vastitatis]|uniref:xanthine dehydrogenase family protein molybdopterin-binding subunit n=1 Tax=Teichococcus vastitatis TaxID=2307076 RepID=UPI000E76F0AD|nr:xanthine dehydrogenase family protein molybdopterin-binding subunit [Pseudoroseomonas vastitatis]